MPIRLVNWTKNMDSLHIPYGALVNWTKNHKNNNISYSILKDTGIRTREGLYTHTASHV